MHEPNTSSPNIFLNKIVSVIVRYYGWMHVRKFKRKEDDILKSFVFQLLYISQNSIGDAYEHRYE